MLCRWCRSPSGSDRPMTMATLHSGAIAPLDHHLRPVTTKSSPSASMRVAMLFASELATSGSVMEYAERISPRSSGSSHFCWTAGAALAGEEQVPQPPALRLRLELGHHRRPSPRVGLRLLLDLLVERGLGRVDHLVEEVLHALAPLLHDRGEAEVHGPTLGHPGTARGSRPARDGCAMGQP